jgi:aminoglycoside phosphotransferase family enzyme/predicted kinase
MAPVKDSQGNSQQPVLAFLGSRTRGKVKRIDTHISIVFLERDRVLKIKRAVRLPYLDFSTLEKRKRACEAELAVNRRHAPTLYRRVVPITQGTCGLEIDGGGPVIEWAVEMARFDESRTLDHLAARGEITPELGDAVADVMLASHRAATASDGSSWLGSISSVIDRNTQKFRALAFLADDDVERLHAESHRQLDALFPPMRKRAAAGLARRCHGDAHLGNIVLIDDKPVLFDAIEFDPAIATIDLLYDLAFPIMDLVHFDQHLVANRLFNRYLQATWQENADALRILPLFLSIRAAIRAYVLFTRHEQSATDAAAAAQAKSYFDLALALIAPGRPSLIAVGGRSGTGKSVLARTIAAMLAPPPGGVVLRSDVIRKELFDADPLLALPETAYTAEITRRVYDTLMHRGGKILKQGFSVVLDAAFLREAERNAPPALASASGAVFRGIFLEADLNVRVQRIASRGPDASDATRDIALLQEGFDLGRLDWPKVDASGSPQETLARALAYLPPQAAPRKQ